MRLEGIPFQAIDWSRIEATAHPGHVLLVLDGQLVTELSDGRRTTLGPGDTYVVADGDGAHRSSSPGGARLFIVD